MPLSKDHQILLHKLSQAGLTPSEAKFYVAALLFDRASIRDIADKAGLNRSAAYTVVKNLKRLGILSTVTVSGKLQVTPITPDRLLDLQKDRLATLETAIGDLGALYKLAQQEPSVKFYEGEDGLRTVLNTVLKQAKSICIFGDGDAFRQAIPGWTETYADRRSRQGIKARLVLKGTPGAIASAKALRTRSGTKSELTKMRLLPEAMHITGGFDVFDNQVILYSFDDRNTAVVIDSPIIARMMTGIFEILWSLAETYDRTLLR